MATTQQFNPLTGGFDLVLLATANVQAWMATPSSANLATAVTDETGSGALVFGTGPTLSSPLIAKIGNLTSNGFVKTSGGDGTLSVDTATYLSTLTVGTTTITSGTTGRVLYDNAGVLGEMTTTGSGTVLALATSPVFTTPSLGVATATSVTFGGFTSVLTSDANDTLAQRRGTTAQAFYVYNTFTDTSNYERLSVLWSSNEAQLTIQAAGTGVTTRQLRVKGGTGIGGAVTIDGGGSFVDFAIGSTIYQRWQTDRLRGQDTLKILWASGSTVTVGEDLGITRNGAGILEINSSSAGTFRDLKLRTLYVGTSSDVILNSAAAATAQLGADVNGAATSQVLQACNGITGTDKTGGNLTLASGKGTGAGAVSSLIFQTPTVLTTGTTAQSLATRLTIAEGSITIADATNVVLNATTGTKFGTATSQKLSFWNATPIVQPTTGVAGASFTANSGTAVNDASTFDGYTLGQIAKALRNEGLLA